MSKFFSPTTLLFYASEFRDAYEAAGNWPADAIEVNAAVFQEFSQAPPTGKMRGYLAGAIAWVDLPPPPPIDIAEVMAERLDVGAVAWGYVDIDRATTWMTSTIVLKAAEATALHEWRDACYVWLPTATDINTMPAQPARPV